MFSDNWSTNFNLLFGILLSDLNGRWWSSSSPLRNQAFWKLYLFVSRPFQVVSWNCRNFYIHFLPLWSRQDSEYVCAISRLFLCTWESNFELPVFLCLIFLLELSKSLHFTLTWISRFNLKNISSKYFDFFVFLSVQCFFIWALRICFRWYKGWTNFSRKSSSIKICYVKI